MTARTRIYKACVVGAVAGVAGLSLPQVADAHMGSKKYIDAELTQDGVELAVQVPAVDAALALGMGTTLEQQVLRTHGALVGRWLAQGLTVVGAAGPCESRAGAPSLTTRDGQSHVSVGVRYTCPSGSGTLTLTDGTVFEEDPEHETFIAVRSDGGTQAAVLRAGAQSTLLQHAPAAADTAAAFVTEGALHLVTGYDHMLFLLSLILVAGLAVRRDGARIAAKDVAWLVTAFTLGHSVSLVGAALGWVALPTAWVELAIAATIVYVAVQNVVNPDAPDAHGRRRRAWLAGAFGVVHGFGFSSVLAEVGLPATHRVIALASFNIGIELAQLALVAIVLLPLAWAARHAAYRKVAVQGGSLAIAAFGCVWLVERSLAL